MFILQNSIDSPKTEVQWRGDSMSFCISQERRCRKCESESNAFQNIMCNPLLGLRTYHFKTSLFIVKTSNKIGKRSSREEECYRDLGNS